MIVRWLFSSSAKDIGYLYLIFAMFSGGAVYEIITGVLIDHDIELYLSNMEVGAPGMKLLTGTTVGNDLLYKHKQNLLIGTRYAGSYHMKRGSIILKGAKQLGTILDKINQQVIIDGTTGSATFIAQDFFRV